MGLSEADIARKLFNQIQLNTEPESPYPAGFFQKELQPAAVLIPLFQRNGEWELVFIRRTLQLYDRHSGQVAFPGGRWDPGDQNAEDAALREAYEETGIVPGDVKILGRLRDLYTITGYRVTPVIGVIPWPYNLVPQPKEVSRIFTIPLKWLADPANREVRNREINIQGKSIPVVFYTPYGGETLWGASARITLLLLEALGLSQPDHRYR